MIKTIYTLQVHMFYSYVKVHQCAPARMHTHAHIHKHFIASA